MSQKNREHKSLIVDLKPLDLNSVNSLTLRKPGSTSQLTEHFQFEDADQFSIKCDQRSGERGLASSTRRDQTTELDESTAERQNSPGMTSLLRCFRRCFYFWSEKSKEKYRSEDNCSLHKGGKGIPSSESQYNQIFDNFFSIFIDMGSLFSSLTKSKQNHEFSFGTASFRIPNSPETVEKYRRSIESVNENNFEVLRYDRWCLDYKEFINFPWKEVFECLHKAHIETLSCFDCGTSTILRQISHVRFDALITLSLAECQIDNIEDLSWLEAPFIHDLKINRNNLVRLKPLAKCRFNFLRVLYLGHNKAPSLNQLSRIKMLSDDSKPKVDYGTRSTFSIENGKAFQFVGEQDVSVICKVERKKFGRILVRHMNLDRKKLYKSRQLFISSESSLVAFEY